jgi:23S rRNA (cytosine1962-C5)-methyltransferase
MRIEKMARRNAIASGYELLDFGNGRKLEKFGEIVLDRPCPAAEGIPKATPSIWRTARARYDRIHGEQGAWTTTNYIPKDWKVSFPLMARLSPATHWVAAGGNAPDDTLTFQLRASPFGHVGVFPEQHDCWEWIAGQVATSLAIPERRLRVLNLFGSTGGSTLAAAAAGADVVHIDSARNIVDRARGNAELSGLAHRAIRWITEDSVKFCQRELRRGNRYDAVILDPPSYGHGPKGEPWKIGDHLLPLMKICRELINGPPAFVLATCHSPGIGPAELAAYLAEGMFGHCGEPAATGELFLETAVGRRLPSGVFARWPA